jgi:hypothetical protein
MDLTVTTAPSPFILTQSASSPFTLSGSGSATISLNMSPTLVGGIALTGPAGEPAFRALSSFVAGFPNPSEIVASGLSPYTFDVSVSESKAEALVAATAETIFTIKCEGVSIGTVTFAIGATVGVVAFTSTTITKGDLVTIHAPAIQDATLADITFLLA